jgi:hypothetical protein
MSQEIVERVRVKYPTPLGASHGACLLEIAQTLGGGAGLLKKDWGTFVRLPDGTGVAQDIICYPNGRIFDCLGDGDGQAIPSWHEAEGSPVDTSRYYAVGASPVPQPQPQPQPNPQPQPTPCLCKAGEVVELLTKLELESIKRYEIVMDTLARLERQNRLPRPVVIKGGWIGTLRGEVGGIDG